MGEDTQLGEIPQGEPTHPSGPTVRRLLILLHKNQMPALAPELLKCSLS